MLTSVATGNQRAVVESRSLIMSSCPCRVPGHDNQFRRLQHMLHVGPTLGETRVAIAEGMIWAQTKRVASGVGNRPCTRRYRSCRDD